MRQHKKNKNKRQRSSVKLSSLEGVQRSVFICHYCGKLLPVSTLTRDHIVPKQRGGANAKYNIVPSCMPCNNEKGHKFPTCVCEKCRYAVSRWQQAQSTGLTAWQAPEVWTPGTPWKAHSEGI